MKIFSLLDSAIGSTADMSSVTISGSTVQVQFTDVTLAQVAEIVNRLEASPIVERTTVNTASTTGEYYRICTTARTAVCLTICRYHWTLESRAI